MVNAYIVDAFLSFWLWFILAWLCVSVGSNIKKLNHMTDKALFAYAVEALAKRSIMLSIPFVLTYAFLMYRFGILLYQANMGGIGAIGLMVIMSVGGVGAIWLKVLLVLIMHSDYVKASQQIDALKKSRDAAPRRMPV